MTYEDVAAMISRMAEEVGGGCRYTYYQWPPEPPEQVPSPPYILFWYPERDDFLADDCGYVVIEALRIELYTRRKDFTAEAAVERTLRDFELNFTKSETYIDAERMFMTLYELEVCIHGDESE